MITTQYCLECERIELVNALKTVHARKVAEGDKSAAAALWVDIQFHQHHQHTHTCKEAGHE